MRVDEIRILILKFPKFGSVEAILNIAGSGSSSLNGGEPVNISIRVIPKAQTSFSGPAAHPLKSHPSQSFLKSHVMKQKSLIRRTSDNFGRHPVRGSNEIVSPRTV